MSAMLPMTGGMENGPRWNDAAPVTGAEARTTWNLRDVAGWLKRNSPDNITLTQAWRMADQLCKGPLADVWLDGLREGARRSGVELTSYDQ